MPKTAKMRMRSAEVNSLFCYVSSSLNSLFSMFFLHLSDRSDVQEQASSMPSTLERKEELTIAVG